MSQASMEQKNLTEAAQAVHEDVRNNGASVDWSIEHYAELFGVSRSDLEHEYRLTMSRSKRGAPSVT